MVGEKSYFFAVFHDIPEILKSSKAKRFIFMVALGVCKVFVWFVSHLRVISILRYLGVARCFLTFLGNKQNNTWKKQDDSTESKID